MSQIAMTGIIVVAKEVDGVEMGVLDDGTPFLTGRGLAKACDVVPSAIIKQAEAWASGRRNAFGKLLSDAGYDDESLFIQVVDHPVVVAVVVAVTSRLLSTTAASRLSW